jgi:hypothetical protein
MRQSAIKAIPAGRVDGPSREPQHQRHSELMVARDLAGFTLADAVPDVRGWHVIAADPVSVGTVTRLIVEMRTCAIRYLMIELDPALERRTRRVFASLPGRCPATTLAGTSSRTARRHSCT